jgi:hypothetical protein
VPLDDPGFAVGLPEGEQRQAQLLAFDAEEAALGLEVVADVLTAVIVAEPKSSRHVIGGQPA